MNGELPKGWVWTNLESIAYIVLGQSPPSSTYNEEEIGLPFYQGKSEFGLIYPTPTKWCSSPKKIAEVGDILISVRAPVGPTNICPEKSCIGRGLAAIRGLGNINNKFILYLLRNFEEQFRTKATGTTFEAITGNVLRNFEVPLPPLTEQQRIVNKIEELFTNLDKGVESLNAVKYKLKIYRQAILKYAMEGKLTEKWREENKDKIEIGMPNSDEISNLNFNLFKLYDIPKEWLWIKLNDINKYIQYGTSEKSSSSNNGLPVIRMGNLKEGKIIFDNLKYYPIDWSEKEKYLLEEGDLLFNRTNSLELVGKTAVYESIFIPSVFASYLIRLKINPAYGISEFVSFYINSTHGKKYILSVASQQVGQANVNSKKLLQMPLPLPPLEEQNIIVERIEQLFSLADYIEEMVDSKLEQSKTLRQSILKKAFEGKLVPQDPNDEPAEILLEKIKKQRLNKENLVQEKLI